MRLAFLWDVMPCSWSVQAPLLLRLYIAPIGSLLDPVLTLPSMYHYRFSLAAYFSALKRVGLGPNTSETSNQYHLI
jgi:hypothetical protein